MLALHLYLPFFFKRSWTNHLCFCTLLSSSAHQSTERSSIETKKRFASRICQGWGHRASCNGATWSLTWRLAARNSKATERIPVFLQQQLWRFTFPLRKLGDNSRSGTAWHWLQISQKSAWSEWRTKSARSKWGSSASYLLRLVWTGFLRKKT